MKKSVLIWVCLIGFTTIFWGCQQEQDIRPSGRDGGEVFETASGSALPTSLLTFASRAEYDSIFVDSAFFASKIAQAGFVSLYSTIEDYDVEGSANAVWEDSTGAGTNSPDTVYDDYGMLPKFLNTDKIVKISPYLFKVDLINEQVLVLDEANEIDYADLAASDLTNPDIMVFSTEDDVFAHLDSGYTTSQPTSWFGGCGDKRAKKGDDRDPVSISSKRRLIGKVQYKRIPGFYCTLFVESTSQKKSWGVWWRDGVDMNINYLVGYGQRCAPVHTPIHGGFIGGSGKVKKRFYENSKALSWYYLEAECQTIGNNNTVTNTTRVIKIEDQ